MTILATAVEAILEAKHSPAKSLIGVVSPLSREISTVPESIDKAFIATKS